MLGTPVRYCVTRGKIFLFSCGCCSSASFLFLNGTSKRVL